MKKIALVPRQECNLSLYPLFYGVFERLDY